MLLWYGNWRYKDIAETDLTWPNIEDLFTMYSLLFPILLLECDEVGSELNAKAALEDVGHNADLYIAIQEDNMQD